MIPFCCLCSPATKDGFAIHVYTASTSMDGCCLANADGDFLIVPQQGATDCLPAMLNDNGAAYCSCCGPTFDDCHSVPMSCTCCRYQTRQAILQ
jgi:homogentisate 1,2-dioxygenase